MTINIRPMLPEDRSALIQILRDTAEFKAPELVVAEEVINSYLHDPGGSGYYILIARIASSVAGYICYGPTPLTDGTWDIYWQAVAQEKRGQGIGSVLTEEAEKEIRKTRARLIIIETSSTHAYEKTLHFHRCRGYEVIARIPDFYFPGDDKLILQKQLS